jgi:hypothetical protein
VRTKNF